MNIIDELIKILDSSDSVSSVRAAELITVSVIELMVAMVFVATNLKINTYAYR